MSSNNSVSHESGALCGISGRRKSSSSSTAVDETRLRSCIRVRRSLEFSELLLELRVMLPEILPSNNFSLSFLRCLSCPWILIEKNNFQNGDKGWELFHIFQWRNTTILLYTVNHDILIAHELLLCWEIMFKTWIFREWAESWHKINMKICAFIDKRKVLLHISIIWIKHYVVSMS